MHAYAGNMAPVEGVKKQKWDGVRGCGLDRFFSGLLSDSGLLLLLLLLLLLHCCENAATEGEGAKSGERKR